MLKGSKMSKAKLREIRRKREAKRKAARGKSPLYLSGVLGTGINQTYAALEAGKIKGAFRLGGKGKRGRWIIPDPVIEALMRGELEVPA
jgi:hypothetical protein